MTTTTATSTSAVQNATKTLLSSLGTGSGVDTGGLVTSLVEAQFATRSAQLTARADKLTAQISGVSTIRNAINGFATALETLAKSGTLSTQPRSSVAGVLSASALPGAALASLSTTVKVDRLAAGQTAVTGKLTVGGSDATRTTPLGSGTLTLTLGTAEYGPDGSTITDLEPASGPDTSVSITLDNASIDQVAAAINTQAAKLGVQATVVTDAKGAAYLSLKGATGEAKAFKLETSGDAALEQLRVGKDAPTRIITNARNAELTVDGILVTRGSNTVDDLVAGVTLELTAIGTTSLTGTRPTAAIGQAVDDIVATYNEVLAMVNEQTDAKTGPLAGDPAAQALLRSLRGLTLASLNPAAAEGTPKTLAELGVRTARDGTLSVDTAQLNKVLADNPAAAEAMFASGTSGALPAVLKTLAAGVSSTISGLGASSLRYTAQQGELGEARSKIEAESEVMTTRLTAQFSAMNARVSAYKSVQSFLTNQIAAWNRSDS